MHQATAVSSLEAFGDLLEQRQRLTPIERAAAEELRKAFAGGELHDQKGLTFVALEAEERRDVGMVERC